MPDISKINVGGVSYDIKDISARSDILTKQDVLASGTNIKTINNNSILGSGNIPVVQGDYDLTNNKVELEQGNNALSFIQTTDGLSVTANTGSGSGSDFINRELVSKTYVSQYQTQAQVEALILDELSRFDKLDYQIVTTLPATGTAGVRYLIKHATDDRYEEYIYINGQWYDIGATDEVNLDDYYTKQEADLLLADKANTTDIPTLTSELTNDGDGTHNFVTFGDAATENVYGVVKLNQTQNIDLNSNGQLVIGGRLGQTPQGGLYYPLTSIPASGSANSLLLSEAVGLSIGSRSLATGGGSNLTLKVTAAAGATTYQIANTQDNRFVCAAWTGGRLATSQDGAGTKTVAITSIKFANGNTVTPYFGSTEANNNIIITVDESLNPDNTLSQVRGYGKWSSTDTLSVGQGNGSVAGKTLLVGQGLWTNTSSQNQIAMIGNRMYTSRGSCIVVGADNINAQQYGAIFGQGHDTTSGTPGIACFGKWSNTSNTTLLAVGNGTSYTARSNAFEVTTDGGIILKSPGGNRFKITVDNSGNLTTTSV